MKFEATVPKPIRLTLVAAGVSSALMVAPVASELPRVPERQGRTNSTTFAVPVLDSDPAAMANMVRHWRFLATPTARSQALLPLPSKDTVVPLGTRTHHAAPSVMSTPQEAMMAHIEKIAELHDGWWGPGSRAVEDSLLRFARSVMPTICSLAPNAAIGPHPSGSLVIEWSRGACEYTAELNADGTMELSEDDTITDEFVGRHARIDARTLVSFVEDARGE